MGDSNPDPALVQDLKGHRKNINSLKFHPNNKELVSGSDDNNLMIWNIKSKDVRCYKFSGHTQAVTEVDCSSNGQLIASCSHDQMVRIWLPSVRGGSAEFRAHMTPVNTVHFSPDSKNLLTGANDKAVKMWDVHTKKFLSSFIGHNNWIYCARFGPDGKTIVSCADDKTIKVWDVTNKQCVHSFTHSKGSATHIAIHNNGNSIAVAMETGSVRIYDIRSKKLQQHYVLHDKTNAIDWHPLGKHLLTCGSDGTMRILDVMEGRPLYTLQGMGESILSVNFTTDGEYFASAGLDKNVMIWKTNFIQNDSNDFEHNSVNID